MNSLEIAAWVQAFGVILAISAGFFTARHQLRLEHQRQRFASALQRRERLKAASQLVTAVKRIAVKARSLAQVVPDSDDAERTVDLFVTELRVVGEAIRQFDVSLFTSHVPIEAMLVSGSLAQLLAGKLAGSAHLGAAGSIRDNVGILDVAIGELDERTARLTQLMARPRDI